MIEFNAICHLNEFEDFNDFVIPCEVTDKRKGSLEFESVFVSMFHNGDAELSMRDLGSYEVDFDFTDEEVKTLIDFVKTTTEYKNTCYNKL